MRQIRAFKDPIVIIRWLIAGVIAAIVLGLSLPASARSLALVVGNNGYLYVPKLKTAVADSSDVGDALERLGFVVRRVHDVDRGAMSRAIAAFAADIRPGDRALFFYAGHGFEISGANYLLPVDIPSPDSNAPSLLRDASIPVETIIDAIREQGAEVAILVLDACRDNPFAPPGRGAASGGLARIDAPEGVFVLMSAGAKQVALDRLAAERDPRNSVFTRTFLKELSNKGLTLVQIAKQTQVAVHDLAAKDGYEQTPAYYDQVVGDIVLTDASEAAPAPNASPSAKAAANSGGQTSGLELPPTPSPGASEAQGPEFAAITPPNLPGVVAIAGRAPIASFMRSNAGWTVTVSLPEPATDIAYRIGDKGEFKSTGVLDALDAKTGRRMANPSFPLSARAEAAIIEVRYVTADGAAVGPFPIRFDPDIALFREQKQILESMPTNWVEFREFNGLIVYFTTLVTYRCAISEVAFGLDDGKPLQRFDLPPCDARDPFALPSDAKLFLKVPPKTKAIHLKLTWRDGTQSEETTIERD